ARSVTSVIVRVVFLPGDDGAAVFDLFRTVDGPRQVETGIRGLEIRVTVSRLSSVISNPGTAAARCANRVTASSLGIPAGEGRWSRSGTVDGGDPESIVALG